MLGDSVLRGARPRDFIAILVYSILGTLIGLGLTVIAVITAAYTTVEFPTSNEGQYGFLMKSVQPRVPLANSGGGTVSAPPYNSGYTGFGISPGAPINPIAFYTSSVPFSTCAWWSRLVSQKAPTDYTPSMPYIYCGTFNLYRSKTVPSFAFTIARPYGLGAVDITATQVCGQQVPATLRSRSLNVSDGAPTCFTAPILWNNGASRPYVINSEMNYSARETGNMTTEINYNTPATGESLRIILSQITPYVAYTISSGATVALNQYYRDDPFNSYQVIPLINVMASGPPPMTSTGVTHMVFKTQILTPPVNPAKPPLGLSQTSIVIFEITFDVPVTVAQLVDYTVLITTNSTTAVTILPTRYYIADPKNTVDPTDWMHFDQLVVSTILGASLPRRLTAFVSNTSSGGSATLTYTSSTGQPIFFIPSLSMLAVGKISGATPVNSLPPPIGINYWLSPQGATSVYIAPSGSFNVSYVLIEPPRLGMFNIYPSFDANSLKRLTVIFQRDLEALYAIDIANDSFYTSVRKIFTFAQYTYAVFNYPASSIVNVLLPPLRNHLGIALDALIQTDVTHAQLGFNPNLFTIATGSQQYGDSQNQMFGDNHVGQYGMILYTYYILVSIQSDNTARRAMRDRYQSVMVDLMRDFAQPYVTDQYIPSMRHFDYSVGLSWQTSSIIEASSLQVSEIINGYYASWLVAQLFGDNKLRDYYRAILSIEMATHQEYRLAPLAPQGESSIAPIYQMIVSSNGLFDNIQGHLREAGIGPPLTYTQYGTVVFLLQGGQIVLHGVSNDHPDYRYLLDNINPNTVADFSTSTFYRPMTPLTIGVVPLTLGINLNSFQTTVFVATAGLAGSSGVSASSLQVLSHDSATGLPVTLLTLQDNPASFMTVQGSYSLTGYARNYVVNYTWAGANLPEETCAIIPASDLPTYLSPVIQYNRLGVLDSNTILWIQYVILANGPRNP